MLDGFTKGFIKGYLKELKSNRNYQFMRVLFVCLGNICRSPMAEGLFIEKVKTYKIKGVEIDSAGTGNYHIGEFPDERMRETALSKGIKLESRARQFQKNDFEKFDMIIAMDRQNKSNILSLAKNETERKKVHLMRDFDLMDDIPDVPDPYFGGQSGFENVYDILDRSTENLIQHILKNSPGN